MKYARIINDEVIEIVNSDNIAKQFHPTIAAEFEPVDANVQIGMIRTDAGFDFSPVVEQTIEEKRAKMRISSANARLNLVKFGLLLPILEQINALPDDAEIKIMWEYATVYDRLNPVLIAFCHEMGLTDDKIDELFIS